MLEEIKPDPLSKPYSHKREVFWNRIYKLYGYAIILLFVAAIIYLLVITFYPGAQAWNI